MTAKNYTKLDMKQVPLNLVSATIGFLGMPGLTAYFGLTEICRIKEGNTLLVSGAAGACGSVAGQVGRILGCKNIIGIAGTAEKLKYLTEELGYDVAINYKDKSREQLIEEIRRAAPNGVDIYYDNVGGEISNAVISSMNPEGRIAVCGQISQYNITSTGLPEDISLLINQKQIDRKNFMFSNFSAKIPEAWAKMFQWTQDGQLKIKETFFHGIENWPEAFLGLFSGDNLGKAIIQVSQ